MGKSIYSCDLFRHLYLQPSPLSFCSIYLGANQSVHQNIRIGTSKNDFFIYFILGFSSYPLSCLPPFNQSIRPEGLFPLIYLTYFQILPVLLPQHFLDLAIISIFLVPFIAWPTAGAGGWLICLQSCSTQILFLS